MVFVAMFLMRNLEEYRDDDKLGDIEIKIFDDEDKAERFICECYKHEIDCIDEQLIKPECMYNLNFLNECCDELCPPDGDGIWFEFKILELEINK